MIINSIGNTPFVMVDFKNNIIEIKGDVVLKNGHIFFKPLEKMIDLLFQTDQVIMVNLMIGSMDQIAESSFIHVMYHLGTKIDTISNVVINWYYKNENMLVYGEYIQQFFCIDFIFCQLPIEYKIS